MGKVHKDKRKKEVVESEHIKSKGQQQDRKKKSHSRKKKKKTADNGTDHTTMQYEVVLSSPWKKIVEGSWSEFHLDMIPDSSTSFTDPTQQQQQQPKVKKRTKISSVKTISKLPLCSKTKGSKTKSTTTTTTTTTTNNNNNNRNSNSNSSGKKPIFLFSNPI